MFETFSTTRLSKKDFHKLKNLVEDTLGIKMPETKQLMLEARLRKRLRNLNMSSYSEYCDFLFSDEGQSNELVHMLDVTTTNKTEFFRESRHFEFLTNQAISEILRNFNISNDRNIKMWSAGCSTGEEPYTIAMVLSNFIDNRKHLDYRIFATDISTKVLSTAENGIYEIEKVDVIDYEMKKKYLLKSKDPKKKLVRIIPELRKRVIFQRMNLISEDFCKHGKFHIIFCRNVMIYFNKENQKRVVKKFYDALEKNGYLFIGHSETLLTVDLPLIQRAPSVYQKV
ncbi:MAG: protein-glutamate O-methyltransferase CheR [Ignavibacteria bacterium]|jgi:chemotaxis protein methyltransferase CheR